MIGTITKTRALALSAVVLLGACAGPSFQLFEGRGAGQSESQSWRTAEERKCLGTKGILATAFVDRKDPIHGRGACGIRHPFKLEATNLGTVKIKPEATLNCQMVVAVNQWMRNVVQPAALLRFGQPVVSVQNMGSYNCRTRNHRKGAKLSEHSFGNALDISSFTLAGGRTISVKDDWDSFFGLSRASGFLHAVHRKSCGQFKTVLGPDADKHHKDHFHIDLARHNSKGTSYCR